MLQPDFDPEPTTVRIPRCAYVSPCRARGCLKRATLIAKKTDAASPMSIPRCIDVYRWRYSNALPERRCSVALEIDTMKAFRTTELQMPDIIGLFSILTQKLTHF